MNSVVCLFLTNAPYAFQRLKDTILSPARNLAAVYLDDVFIHSSTIEEGLISLNSLFEILKEEELAQNFSKCRSMMCSIFNFVKIMTVLEIHVNFQTFTSLFLFQ